MNQNTPQQFASQLREGQYNELRVALYLMLQGCHVKIGFSNQRYDISVQSPNGKNYLVEVKWDKASAKTGNLYFEVENTRQGVASGIAATTATLWCHVMGDGQEALLAPVEFLRKMLDEGNYRSISTGGSDSNSRGKLVPLDTLRKQTHKSIRWIKLPTEQDFFNELFRNNSPASLRAFSDAGDTK